jgi:hypothetical protein
VPYTNVTSTQSTVYRLVEKVRFLLNEPEVDARWPDAYLLNEVIQPAYVTVLSRLSLQQDNPPILRATLSLTNGQEFYELPTGCRAVVALGKIEDTSKKMTVDWLPGHLMSTWGIGWALVGNTIQFNPVPTTDETWTLWYIPSGDFFPHYATTGVQSNTDDDNVFRVATAPSLGLSDLRPNAMAGGLLRCLLVGGVTYTVERMITASLYDGSACRVTLSHDLPTSLLSVTGVKYEVVPQGFPLMWKAVALYAACELAIARNVNAKEMRHLYLERDNTMKTLYDDLSSLNARMGKAMRKDTTDNPDLTLGGLLDELR